MSPQLEAWRKEIETLSGGIAVIVPVETDPVENVLRIPPLFPGRPVVAQLLSAESFVAQLVRAHALNVNVDGATGVFHFVLLNMARSADWRTAEGNEMEDSLLAHELGHVWLNAMGYRSPNTSADPVQACLAMHAGDIVQHILIREEAKRRGFDTMRFWLQVQQRAMEAQRGEPVAAPDRCELWQAAAEWMDALGGASQWSLLPRYETLMKARFPQLVQPVSDMRDRIQGLDLWDRSLYEHALSMLTAALLTIS